jgi:hypothetical protein
VDWGTDVVEEDHLVRDSLAGPAAADEEVSVPETTGGQEGSRVREAPGVFKELFHGRLEGLHGGGGTPRGPVTPQDQDTAIFQADGRGRGSGGVHLLKAAATPCIGINQLGLPKGKVLLPKSSRHQNVPIF